MKKSTSDLLIKINTMIEFCMKYGNNFKYSYEEYDHHSNTIGVIFNNYQEREKFLPKNQEYQSVSVENNKFYFNSWCISGHNGDSYGFKKQEIKEDDYEMFAKRAEKFLFDKYVEAKHNKIKKESEKAAQEAFRHG